eukprot:TRINITY_DN11999_c0_g1_i1.p1 TRINITY_DN11999_c0_g1~~TRINITY_DN11999_c0_g1_i1.p1  ORF type:complete len:115 (+),score=7.39 TRINITY_DN11999_c0_g1_i1:102-446(+)
MQSLALGILICIVGVASSQDHVEDSPQRHQNNETIKFLSFALRPPTLPKSTRMHSLMKHFPRHKLSHAQELSLHSRRSDGNDGAVLRQLDLLGQPHSGIHPTVVQLATTTGSVE